MGKTDNSKQDMADKQIKAKEDLKWIMLRFILAIISTVIYIVNSYNINKAYEILDLSFGVTTNILMVVAMLVAFIIVIIKCAKNELTEKNISITSKTVKKEKEMLKLESKLIKFVSFTKSKSWFLLWLALSTLIPSVIGITLYVISLVLMLILSSKKKFKETDKVLNISILGMASVIIRSFII